MSKWIQILVCGWLHPGLNLKKYQMLSNLDKMVLFELMWPTHTMMELRCSFDQMWEILAVYAVHNWAFLQEGNYIFKLYPEDRMIWSIKYCLCGYNTEWIQMSLRNHLLQLLKSTFFSTPSGHLGILTLHSCLSLLGVTPINLLHLHNSMRLFSRDPNYYQDLWTQNLSSNPYVEGHNYALTNMKDYILEIMLDKELNYKCFAEPYNPMWGYLSKGSYHIILHAELHVKILC